jgi:hypothetical protein
MTTHAQSARTFIIQRRSITFATFPSQGTAQPEQPTLLVFGGGQPIQLL